MTVIYKKELRRLLGGFLAYGAIAVLLLAYGFYTSYGNLFLAYTDITNTLVGSFYALLVALPMVTCGLYAYEYRSRGTGLWYSLGFTPTQIVLGKLLAALTVVGFALGVLALTPVFISFFGEVDRTLCYFSWLGYLLLTVALTALCAFLSAFWKRAWVAFLVSMGAMVLLWLLNLILTALPVAAWFSFVIVELLLLGVGAWLYLVVGARRAVIVSGALPVLAAVLFILKSQAFVALIPRALAKINPFSRFSGFLFGSFDLGGIVYLISFAVFFTVLTVLVLRDRRENEF